MGRIRVGTSGYAYKHWRDLLYEGVPPPRWLERYAQVFDTVELNATFYRLPSASMVDGWRDRTPRGFLFACKGSRYITHMKRLKDPGPALERYFEVVLRLGPKLGPILWQLPPRMNRPDLPRLDDFLARVPQQLRHAVEFRNAAWYTGEVCEVLDRHGAAFCACVATGGASERGRRPGTPCRGAARCGSSGQRAPPGGCPPAGTPEERAGSTRGTGRAP